MPMRLEKLRQPRLKVVSPSLHSAVMRKGTRADQRYLCPQVMRNDNAWTSRIRNRPLDALPALAMYSRASVSQLSSMLLRAPFSQSSVLRPRFRSVSLNHLHTPTSSTTHFQPSSPFYATALTSASRTARACRLSSSCTRDQPFASTSLFPTPVTMRSQHLVLDTLFPPSISS